MRVVVFSCVAAEAEIVEQELVERDDALLGAVGLRQARAQADRHALDLAQVMLHAQPGIGVFGDQQAGLGEVDARVLPLQQFVETFHGHPPALSAAAGKVPQTKA